MQLRLVGEGVHALLLSLYLSSQTKLQCTLQLRGLIYSPYFCSTPICTQWEQYWRDPRFFGSRLIESHLLPLPPYSESYCSVCLNVYRTCLHWLTVEGGWTPI
jgi:hypothetical protein